MWKSPGLSLAGEGPSVPIPLYNENISRNEVSVLLVDNDRDSLLYTASMLQSFSYKVTPVQQASTAILLLSQGKKQFNILLADIHLADHDDLRLFQQAIDMYLPVMMMTAQEDAIAAKKALKSGAFLFVQKPIPMEILKYLWQDVLRENTRNIKKRKEMHRNYEMVEETGNASKSKSKMGKDGLKMENRSRKCSGKDEERESEDKNNTIKRKNCTEWTKELHEKFMDAVSKLGEGRCYPKEILELMNVPGLTRMQVASHLQKCRNDNWRSPEDRKFSQESSQTSLAGSQCLQHKRLNPRRFGTMPRTHASSSNNFHPQGSQENYRGLEISLASKGSEEAKEQTPSRSHAIPQQFLVSPIQSKQFVAENKSEHELATAMERHSHQQQYYKPILSSDLYAATNETASRVINASGQRGPPEDFYNCLQEMGDHHINLHGMPRGSMGNHIANPPQSAFDFNQVFFN